MKISTAYFCFVIHKFAKFTVVDVASLQSIYSVFVLLMTLFVPHVGVFTQVHVPFTFILILNKKALKN